MISIVKKSRDRMNLFYGLKLASRGLSCLKSLSLSFSCLRGDQMHELFTALGREDSQVVMIHDYVDGGHDNDAA